MLIAKLLRHIFFSIFLIFSAGSWAQDSQVDNDAATETIDPWLFNQTWSVKEDNQPGDGSFAMWCGDLYCEFAKPIKRDRRKYRIEGRAIQLNYDMEGYEIEEIQIIDLTDGLIKLKFPGIDEVQTFYRAK